MFPEEKVFWIVYLIQFITGILGNALLFCMYIFNFRSGYRKRSIDPILLHFIFTNALLLLFRGIPEMLRVRKWEYFVTDIGCKFVFYLQSVFRDLSLSSTSLLTVFQAITISPTTLYWYKIKTKASKCVLPCCLLCWIFNMLIDMFIPVYVTGPKNSTIKGRLSLGFCSLNVNGMRPLKPVIWKSVYNFVFVGIMAYSSVYMVFILYRHHQQVKNIHHTNLASSISPEIQATKSILLLVSTFVCFSTVSGPIIIYIESFQETISWTYYVSALLSMSFPSLSPFVLLSSDTHILKSFCVL